MTSDTLVCVLLAALAYSMLNVGIALEKRGAAALPALEQTGLLRNIKNFLTNPIWLAGFLLTNLQIVPLAAALARGPLSLVSPMLGVGLVVLVLFAHFFLHERITTAMAVGVGLTITGVVLFGVAGGDAGPPASWAQARATTAHPLAWGVLLVLLAGSLGPGLLSRALGWALADVLFGLASSFAASLGLVATKLLMSAFAAGEPGLAALGRDWPYAAVLLLLLLGGNGGSMVLQQVGFQKGRAVVLAPVYTVGFILLPAIAGALLFGELADEPPGTLVLRSAGLAGLLGGAALLSLASVTGPTGRAQSGTSK